MGDHQSQLILGLRQRRPRAQSGEKWHVAFAPIIFRVAGVEAERDPDLHVRRREAEILWHHSHNLPVNSVEGNRASEDPRITPESVLPECVAEDNSLVASRLVPSGDKRVSDFRSRAEKRE